LPNGGFELGQTNTLTAYINTVNGQADAYHGNDTIGRSFQLAPGTSQKVYLFLKTDNLPLETSWELIDEQGVVVNSGGPYTQSGHIYQQTFTLNPGCYTFNLRDAGGNGICCTNGYGVFQLTSDISGQILGEGDDFGYEAVHAFKVGGYAGLEEKLAFTEPVIFPNPAWDEAVISLRLFEAAPVTIEILDLHGRSVLRQSTEFTTPGSQHVPVSLTDLEDGLYMVKVQSGNQARVLKLNVIH